MIHLNNLFDVFYKQVPIALLNFDESNCLRDTSFFIQVLFCRFFSLGFRQWSNIKWRFNFIMFLTLSGQYNITFCLQLE